MEGSLKKGKTRAESLRSCSTLNYLKYNLEDAGVLQGGGMVGKEMEMLEELLLFNAFLVSIEEMIMWKTWTRGRTFVQIYPM